MPAGVSAGVSAGVVVSAGVSTGLVVSAGLVVSVGVSAWGWQAAKVVTRPNKTRMIAFDFTVHILTLILICRRCPILTEMLSSFPGFRKGLSGVFSTTKVTYSNTLV